MARVEWLDARSAGDSWECESSGILDEGLCEVVTCGFVVKEDYKHVVLALCIADDAGDDPQFYGMIFIPRESIVRFEELESREGGC